MKLQRLQATLITCCIALAAAPAFSNSDLPVLDRVGGDFSASSTLDRELRLSEFRGQIVLLSFGYTSCQDVCPTTMTKLHALLSNLGSESATVQVLFVTVDPITDTVERLRDYMSRFDSRFIGITGSKREIASIAGLFMAKHDAGHDMKVSTHHHKAKTYADETFLYAHSQQIYLLDDLGRTRALYFTGSPLSEMQTDIRSLLSEQRIRGIEK